MTRDLNSKRISTASAATACADQMPSITFHGKPSTQGCHVYMCAGTDEETTLDRLMRGTMSNILQCMHIDFRSTRHEGFTGLHLDVIGSSSVYEALQAFCKVRASPHPATYAYVQVIAELESDLTLCSKAPRFRQL